MASTKTEYSTTWATPRTWATDELVTATMLNDEIRDNENALKTPAYGLCVLDEAADFSTTSATYADVDAAGSQLTLTITTGGGLLEIGFIGSATMSGPAFAHMDVTLDGTRIGGDDGLLLIGSGAAASTHRLNASFSALVDGVAAGSHTFVLQYKVSGGVTLTIPAGAATSSLDIHPRFYVIER
jgi:hypothetical protein